MSFVRIVNVSKTYGAAGSIQQVLRDVNEQIAEGEFVALMGPSGSGKSTLLTVVGAMNRPTHGQVIVDGIDVYGLHDEVRADFRREYLGFVFQQHCLMPYLTVLQNVMLPLVATRMSGLMQRERAMESLERVGLGLLHARLPNQLSGGEQGRLAIARALVDEPPLLLADEPTGALDSATGAEVMDVFRTLNSRGQTIFMVTHNPENAALAHRTIYIRDGMIQESIATKSISTPQEAEEFVLAGKMI